MKASLLIEGFLAKIITGADDTLTHAPLLSSLTKKKREKFSFIIGMILSILVLILLSMFFAGLLQKIPYRHIISAVLLLFLAVFVYYNKFIRERQIEYCERFIKKPIKKVRILTLFGMGFIAFFATGIDDVIVYSSLLVKGFPEQLLIASGILIAALFEFFIIFYFSRQISKFRHVNKITIIGLVVFAVLVGFRIV